MSVLIFAISTITILEYITGIHFNIDELLINDTDAIKYFNFAGRMAPGTVFNFLLLSIALILKLNNKLLALVQWIAFFIFLISFFAILCKIYNVEYFSFIEKISLLPTNSSICFLVFSTAIAFSNPHLGIIKIMYSTTPIGVTARRIIPAVVIIPIVSGFFRLKGEELGYFDTRYGLAVFSFANITGLLLISYFGLKKIAINEQLLIHSKKKLKQSEADLIGIIDNTEDMIWSINKNRDLIKFNSKFNEYLFLLKGKRAHKRMPIIETENPLHIYSWKSWYKKAFMGESFTVEHVNELHNKKQWQEISFNPIIVSDNVSGVAVFSKDITEKKEVQQKLEHANSELKTFMYKATHDLKGPLASILGLVNLSNIETREEKSTILFNKIGESTKKLDATLNVLLDTMYIKESKKIISKINLKELVNTVCDSLRHSENYLKIHFNTQVNAKKEFVNDEKIIRSIVQNLIENSLKYYDSCKQEPSIEIHISDYNEGVKIIISDNGVGIKKEFHSKIFEMFYRASESSKGSGLGLYLVKTGIEKINGTIEFSSQEGVGTTFTLTIPSIS